MLPRIWDRLFSPWVENFVGFSLFFYVELKICFFLLHQPVYSGWMGREMPGVQAIINSYPYRWMRVWRELRVDACNIERF